MGLALAGLVAVVLAGSAQVGQSQDPSPPLPLWSPPPGGHHGPAPSVSKHQSLGRRASAGAVMTVPREGVAELGYDKFIVRAPKNNTSKNAELMQCPECQSTHVNKNGQKKGKQNYICVGCGRQFIDCYQPHKGYSEEVKRECLKMYVNGMGFRAIERIKGVHHTSIINWVSK
jgi:ribosomal protein L37AE/L43A